MLAPELLASIHDLEFVARVTVEGALAGLHRSPFHGYSAEFSQYRHYRAGDDLKYIDWKLFARTDRIYTKQYRETTNARVQIVLDASASMGYRGEAGASKIDYARMLSGALAHLVADQGDAVGVTVYADRIRAHVASRSGRAHLRAVLVTLAKTIPDGPTAPAAALRRATDLLKDRGVVALVSDLYDDRAELDAELRRAARVGHDVTVFHVLSPDELEWSWGDAELVDSETGERVMVTGGARAEYAERVQAFVGRWQQRCVTDGIDYVLCRTDVPLERTLRRYLLKRRATRP